MNNKELQKQAENYIEENGINKNTYAIEKAFRDGAKMILNQGQSLPIDSVSKSLPTKEDAVAEGYRIAKYAGYNYRRVLKEPDHDIYYSGWMDCHDWMTK